MLGTVNFIGYLIGTLILSPLIARFPNRRHAINQISCLLLGLAMIGSTFSNHLFQLGLWRFAIGLLSAFAAVLVLSIALDAVRSSERGLASGLIWLGGSAGILVTGLFAPYTIDPSHVEGWRYAWAVMGIFGIIAGFGFGLITKQMRVENKPLKAEISPRDQKGGVNVYLLMFHPNKLLFLTGSYFFFGSGYII